MRKIFVYGLEDPRTKELKYIGRTMAGMTRPLAHSRPAYFNNVKNKNAKWVQELAALGLKPRINVLEACSSTELFELEEFYIGYFRAIGADLNNRTFGGKSDKPCVPRIISEEQKRKTSQALLGKKKSLETRRKMSLANKGKVLSEEHRRKMSESLKGRVGPNKGKKMSDETKARISASKKAQFLWNKGLKK